jgi:sulfite reductase (NADPH) hemoprotein beta-component
MITESAPAKPTRNEGLKENDPLLSGTIHQTLADPAADHFTDDDYEFLKVHGVYQQDDRDLRKTGKKYIMMVRTRFPGGTLSARQYIVCHDLAEKFANGTLRITTRQDFQFHGIIKANLRQTIHDLNQALMTTMAACGDVARNVLAPPTPSYSPVVEEVLSHARRLSEELLPRTRAYHSIWVEGQELKLSDSEKAGYSDPLYRRTYLPRKFKAAFVIPPYNDVDVYANDLGFVAIVEEGRLAGYNLLAGGGQGMSHGNAQTFPRLADVVGFLLPESLSAVAKAVLTVHRDFGDRTNRKHARLKYVLEERGVDWFRGEVEQRAGVRLEAARPFEFKQQGDVLGWNRQLDDRWFLGLFVENGRIRDEEGYRLKTALRAVMDRFAPEVRLTATQNLLLVNIPDAQKAELDSLLAAHGVSSRNPFSRVRQAAMACPALPTCGLALAESERALPSLITRVEEMLREVGVPDEEVSVRMTGCPNGCARPYLAEIAFVGKAPNKYQIYLGGNQGSTRLNRLWKESIKGEDLLNELRPVFQRFVGERQPGERFGDFCHRTILGSARA